MGDTARQEMEMEIRSVAARLICCPFSFFLSSEASFGPKSNSFLVAHGSSSQDAL